MIRSFNSVFAEFYSVVLTLCSSLFLGSKLTSATALFILLSSSEIPLASSYHSTQPTGSWAKFEVRRLVASSEMSELSDHQPDGSGCKITILGFGSLLSEKSARTTFPDLEVFRLGRVANHRRVFGHPASIFFQRGIAKMETKEISSLSAEFCEGHAGFICSVFEVPNKDMIQDGIPSAAFLAREEEFNIVAGVEYASIEIPDLKGYGILCTSSSDAAYLSRWGEEHFEQQYRQYGVETIWGWGHHSGLRPCAVYLRHFYLAAKSMGKDCLNSFLDEIFLVDRETTVRDYLSSHPEILDTQPPPELVGRYSG